MNSFAWLLAILSSIFPFGNVGTTNAASVQTTQPTMQQGHGPMNAGAGIGYGARARVNNTSQYTNHYISGIGSDDVVPQTTLSYVAQLPAQPLDEQEKEGILHMREEEKLARDVYLTLYEKWGLPIFKNIARSEQNHMNAVKVLIDKYGLEDPVEETGDARGKFVNPELQELYYQLVTEGSESIVDALKVGATIEDLDIKDLETYASETDNEDIKIVYNNLMKGSRNHLRAFTRQLERYNYTYQCQYISEQECEQIINSDWERGVAYNQNNQVMIQAQPMHANAQQHRGGPWMR